MTSSPLVRKLQVFFFCVGAAIAYGIIHDQITARVCIEYFTVGHPPIVRTASPTVLGLVWGVAATWWVGAALGFLLAQASQSAGPPPTPFPTIVRRVLLLLAVMALGAATAGTTGYLLASRSIIVLSREFARQIPFAHLHGFIADSFSHLASYAIGFIGGAYLVYKSWRERGRPKSIQLAPTSTAGKIRLALIAAITVAVLYKAWSP